MTEIEKKFRLAKLPSREILGQGMPIIQGYVITEPELRLRRGANACYLTLKGEGTFIRDEWEVEIPGWVFQTLWPRTEGRRVEKIRYPVPYQGLIVEVDEYLGRHQGLVTMECEFSEENAARVFSLPSWTAGAVDVTEDRRYKNRVLAVCGLPLESDSAK